MCVFAYNRLTEQMTYHSGTTVYIYHARNKQCRAFLEIFKESQKNQNNRMPIASTAKLFFVPGNWVENVKGEEVVFCVCFNHLYR